MPKSQAQRSNPNLSNLHFLNTRTTIHQTTGIPLDLYFQVKAYRKDPVKSDTPGQSSVCARTFAPLLVNLRIRFHPWTPPLETYRVPVTILAPVSICFLDIKFELQF